MKLKQKDKVERRGGARKNGGRPAGSLSKRTMALREIADKALSKGITPLEVMLDNMRYYHQRADQMLKKLDELVDVSELDDESAKVVAAALVRFGETRMKAQQCATDAANYVHPRLSAVAVKNDGDGPVNFNFIMFGAEPQPKPVEDQPMKLINGNGSAH